MRSAGILSIVSLVLGSCGFVPSSVEPVLDAAVIEADATPLPDCTAQRVVHLVGGLGSLAWFTLLWPVPAVIEGFDSTYAYDDPTLATLVSSDRPLYSRTQRAFGAGPLFEGVGVAPHPSAFMIGNNETHTSAPTSAVTLPSGNVIGFGARAQVERLSASLPVLVFGSAPYVAATGGPTALRVDDIDGVIDAIRASTGLTVEQEARLRPDPVIIATWHSSLDNRIIDLANELLFAANLMKEERVGTVVVQGFSDDPHGAFTNLVVTTAIVNDMANVLEGFYRELAKSDEVSCGVRGAPLSLADNVMMVVSGDTPKNTFSGSGWPDGTRNNLNLLYVRSNGWMVPGWFGELTSVAHTAFDPATGELSNTVTRESSLAAALSGVLYAMTRGDLAFASAIDDSEFAGVRAENAP